MKSYPFIKNYKEHLNNTISIIFKFLCCILLFLININIKYLSRKEIKVLEELYLLLIWQKPVSLFQEFDLLSILVLWRLEPMIIRSYLICSQLCLSVELMLCKEQEELDDKVLVNAINSIQKMLMMNL